MSISKLLGRSRPESAPEPSAIGTDETLAKELRGLMDRVAVITTELKKRGWSVFTCVAEKNGELYGNASVDRRQEL